MFLVNLSIYITYCPDIRYAIATISNFSLYPFSFHYKLLKDVAKYLQSTINLGIYYKHPSCLDHTRKGVRVPYNELSNLNNLSPVKGNLLILYATFGNELARCRKSTTSIIIIYCDGAIINWSKTQTLTTGSPTEARFIAAVIFVKKTKKDHCVGLLDIFKMKKMLVYVLQSNVWQKRFCSSVKIIKCCQKLSRLPILSKIIWPTILDLSVLYRNNEATY